MLKRILMITVFCLIAASAAAIEPIPEESGFSGYLSAGAGYHRIKNNMVAGNDFGDVGNSIINSLTDGPDSESDFTPAFSLDVRYTIADWRTQFFFGNTLEDVLRFDMATLAGIRKDFAGLGIIGVAYVFNGIPTEVWADPYVTGQDRIRTDREAAGFRFGWEGILKSGFDFEYTWRDIQIDNERSGTLGGLGLNPGEIALLNRDGERHKAELLYTIRFDQNKQFIIPAFQYDKYDLDGGAMAHDDYSAKLTYGYNSKVYSLVANLFYTFADFDESNPIYGKSREDDVFGASLTAFWHRPFGAPAGWSLLMSCAYHENDANIDFYDGEATMGSLSVFYRF